MWIFIKHLSQLTFCNCKIKKENNQQIGSLFALKNKRKVFSFTFCPSQDFIPLYIRITYKLQNNADGTVTSFDDDLL